MRMKVVLDPIPSGFFIAALGSPPGNNNKYDPALIGNGGF
jgi:hypothetical protein